MPIRKTLPVTDVRLFDDSIVALVRDGDAIRLLSLDSNLEERCTIGSATGRNGYLLGVEGNSYLLGIDNRLVVCEEGKVTSVLRLASPTNILPHAIPLGSRTLVQEYGNPPTGLWLSREKFSGWRRLVTNITVDRYSRHFHDIAYHHRRKWILATLGDGNPVRLISSSDGESTWQTLVRGPWQFYPIAVLEDRIVLGMDSGIAIGGVGTYFPDSRRLEVTLLKWTREPQQRVQMFCLQKLSSNLWVAATSSPAALLVSKDLVSWHLACRDDSTDRPRVPPRVSYRGNTLAFCTGRGLIMFDVSELESLSRAGDPVLVSHLDITTRLRGQAVRIVRWLQRE